MATLRESLREQTRTIHDQVERRIAPLLVEPIVADYVKLLTSMYGYYAPLEDALARNSDIFRIGIDLDVRRKQHLIEADLQVFGVETASLQRCSTLPATTTTGAALGCLYVLEGSTLGGRVIARQVSSQLNVTPGRGLSFFTGYGSQCERLWREFLSCLERAAADDGVGEEACSAAIDCFTKLDRWLERSLSQSTPTAI